MYHSKGHTIPE